MYAQISHKFIKLQRKIKLVIRYDCNNSSATSSFHILLKYSEDLQLLFNNSIKESLIYGDQPSSLLYYIPTRP